MKGNQMTTQEPVHVATIQWGTLYTGEDVNKLFSMVKKNTSAPVCFHLFSNEKHSDLHPEIQLHPEPSLIIPEAHRLKNYRKTVGLCDSELTGLTGKRIFFFDIDVLIMGSLDDLFTYPEGEQFYIINDWNTKGNHVGQATCYSFVVGTLQFVKTDFEAAPEKVIEQYGTATQQYLSAKVIEQFGKLNFWPEEWFQSFRYHCLPCGPLRHILTPREPRSATKVLAFHGRPNMHDAIIGRWSEPGTGKAAKGWKKLYKACRPTPWIEKYWNK
jgi:hypothetical protein